MSNKVRSARSLDTPAGTLHRSPPDRARVPDHHLESERRELSHRSDYRIDVTLYRRPTLDELKLLAGGAR